MNRRVYNGRGYGRGRGRGRSRGRGGWCNTTDKGRKLTVSQTSSGDVQSLNELIMHGQKRKANDSSMFDLVDSMHERLGKRTDLSLGNQSIYHGETRLIDPRQGSHLTFSNNNKPITLDSEKFVENDQYGIQPNSGLVPVSSLPEELRHLFNFKEFNAVQSRCFNVAFNSEENLVVAAPTGSGKTGVFELAMCKTIRDNAPGEYKMVYVGSTKALCAERCRDWQRKFAGNNDIKCVELTGDTDISQIRLVQRATIIVTTPEKWDSITRKWKDHSRLMSLVRLFMIDEIHMLRDERGPTLEVIVARMKSEVLRNSQAKRVRIVALSATIPNAWDIARWLGHSLDGNQAHLEQFDETYRPVRVEKHVLGYGRSGSIMNDFAFIKSLDDKVQQVIARYSQGKPILIFCCTRKDCEQTARILSEWWRSCGSCQKQYWKAGNVEDLKGITGDELYSCALTGVAFHHAGVDAASRYAIEKAFLHGVINVICCTSTLAVGVNLPCHMVILKGTMSYNSEAGGGSGVKLSEYSDFDVIQMIGRAGRPQFEVSGIAVIMTRRDCVAKYEAMVTGENIVESRLHENLIEHVNAEIGVGNIRDLDSAGRWLKGTFLYVRMQANPVYYTRDKWINVDEYTNDLLKRSLEALLEAELIEYDETNKLIDDKGGEARLVITEYGEAMARYCVQFDTMKKVLSIKGSTSLEDLVNGISEAVAMTIGSRGSAMLGTTTLMKGGSETIKFRGGEKVIFKRLNNLATIRFPIGGNIENMAHKVSLVIQYILGGGSEGGDGARLESKIFLMEKFIIFQQAQRLLRCFIDCSLGKEDGKAVWNGLFLERSLTSECWDDSAYKIMVINQIGKVTAKKLVKAGITSVETLINCDVAKLELSLQKNPPFGFKLQAQARQDFPRLNVLLKRDVEHHQVSYRGGPLKEGDNELGMERFCAEVGFENEGDIPEQFRKRTVYVCFLAVIEYEEMGIKDDEEGNLLSGLEEEGRFYETSSAWKVVHFCRISAARMGKRREICFSVNIEELIKRRNIQLATQQSFTIKVFAMCDGIVGTMKQDSLTLYNHKMICDLTRPIVGSVYGGVNIRNEIKDKVNDDDEYGDMIIEEEELRRIDPPTSSSIYGDTCTVKGTFTDTTSTTEPDIAGVTKGAISPITIESSPIEMPRALASPPMYPMNSYDEQLCGDWSDRIRETSIYDEPEFKELANEDYEMILTEIKDILERDKLDDEKIDVGLDDLLNISRQSESNTDEKSEMSPCSAYEEDEENTSEGSEDSELNSWIKLHFGDQLVIGKFNYLADDSERCFSVFREE